MDSGKPHTLGSIATRIVLTLVGLLLLYVLSAGPTSYIWEKHKTGADAPPPPWAATFYAPLRWAGDYTPLGKPIESYIQWWNDLAEPGEPPSEAP